MKRRTIRLFTILLSIAVLCTVFTSAAKASGPADIPSGYVVFDGTDYFLIDYEELLDSYIYYADDPGADEAKLAKFYFDTLEIGFEGHFIAYVSTVTNKYVDFETVLDKFVDTGDLSETYSWFNSDAASAAFDALTEVKLLGADGNVFGSIFIGPDGYEASITVENASVETADSGNPEEPECWSHNSWGSNTTVFTYLTEGHTGSRSIKAEMTDYQSGDAKWFFDPIALAPDDYVFSNWYRSDVDTSVILAVNTAAGGIRYLDMPFCPASEQWTKYEAVFSMPEDGISATVYHLISKDGYLITDDYSIGYYKYEGFERGLVTITFDDGWEENPYTALPIMQQYGFKSNQFYATTYIENPWADNPEELIGLFVDDGHEIGSHTITHPDLTTLTEQEVLHELEGSKQYLEDYLGLDINYFATPYGAYNNFVKDSIMTYYSVHRTVEAGYNSADNLDVSRLKCMCVLSVTTSGEVEEWVRKAKEEKLWLILLYHRIADDPNEHDATPGMFAEHMQIIDNYELPVVLISEALGELGEQ